MRQKCLLVSPFVINACLMHHMDHVCPRKQPNFGRLFYLVPHLKINASALCKLEIVNQITFPETI